MKAWREGLSRALYDSPLWQRWQSLGERDRMALQLLALFTAALLFYLLMWRPISHWQARALEDYQRQQELHLYIRNNANKAKQATQQQRAHLSPQQLQGAVTASAQKNSLSIERFDNESDGALLVTLTQVPFANLLRWLADLQSQGVLIHEANIDGKGTGRVDARLTLTVEG